MSGRLVIDCGTTNLRVTLLNERGEALGMQSAQGGVRHTAIDGHNGRLKTALRETITAVLRGSGMEHGDVGRCVAFGMITSNMGLMEIPHLPAPASCEDLRAGMRAQIFEEIAPFPIHFIPGVRNFPGEVNMRNFSRMDMMRGEETEAIGLYEQLRPEGRAIFVLPGSHNKFVSMGDRGELLGCMTSISGELLDALTHHTIIADAVNRAFAQEATYMPDYVKEGAWECAHSGLGRAAFAGRILSTLAGKHASQMQSYLLGVVLSQDVQAMRAFAQNTESRQIFVAGKPPVRQAMCDVIEALEAGHARQVPAQISGQMGIRGALRIGF